MIGLNISADKYNSKLNNNPGNHNRFITLLNENLLKNKIENFDWDVICKSTEPDFIYNELRLSLNKMYSVSTIRKSKINTRRTDRNWLNEDILHLINERDLAFKRSKNCPSNKIYRIHYFKLRNKVVKEIKLDKKKYYEQSFDNVKSNKDTWKLINKHTGRGGNVNSELEIVQCISKDNLLIRKILYYVAENKNE